jgi:hypothetical protein
MGGAMLTFRAHPVVGVLALDGPCRLYVVGMNVEGLLGADAGYVVLTGVKKNGVCELPKG